jgi:iron complex transport system permease protein
MTVSDRVGLVHRPARPIAGRPPGARLTPGWLAGGLASVVVALLTGLAVGPVGLNPLGVAAEVLNLIPGVDIHSGLSTPEAAIVVDLRLPRVVLGLLVGGVLGLAGACYQGIFRNPLADPYLLGVAAGAGLGATVAAAAGVAHLVPLFAFGCAIGAVALTYGFGTGNERVRTPSALILSGVAVAAFLTAIQTYLLSRNANTIREVYSWLLGRLATTGWTEVQLLLPYAVVCGAVIVVHARQLDVLSVGDDEAVGLGLRPRRTRALLIVAASLGTAAAVSVSGLIGFVGIVVPHLVRLTAGASYRAILPLSVLFGGAFLALTDVVARTAMAPSELPLGVITAFVGAPFFIVILRTTRRVGL